MKSLQESLFDDDLISKEVNHLLTAVGEKILCVNIHNAITYLELHVQSIDILDVTQKNKKNAYNVTYKPDYPGANTYDIVVKENSKGNFESKDNYGWTVLLLDDNAETFLEEAVNCKSWANIHYENYFDVKLSMDVGGASYDLMKKLKKLYRTYKSK